MSFKSFQRLVFSPPYEDGNKYSVSPFFLLAVQRNICVLDDFIGSETIIRAFCLVWSFILVLVASSNFDDLVYILKSHVVWPRLLKRQRGIGAGGVWGVLVHVWGPWAQLGAQGLCSARSAHPVSCPGEEQKGGGFHKDMACSQPTSLVLPSPQGWLVATSQLSSGWRRSRGFPEDVILINLIEISGWVKERNSRQSPAEAAMAGQAQCSPHCLVLMETWGSCPGATGSWSCCSGGMCRASERIKMGARYETAVYSGIVCFGIGLSFCKSAEEGWCIGMAHFMGLECCFGGGSFGWIF